MEYTKKFNFGKVDYNNVGRKTHAVELEVTLKIKGKKRVFTASSNVWNTAKTDIAQGGQCIDSVWDEFSSQLKNPALYKRIMKLWERWHLNDLHAECVHQRLKGKKFVNSLEVGDECKTCGYGYGEAWNYEAIAKKDLQAICELLELSSTEIKKVMQT